MVNVWDYANELPRIKLKTVAGDWFVGKVIMVLNAEETEDVEDSIDVEMGSGEIKSFYQDEIESIEVLHDRR